MRYNAIGTFTFCKRIYTIETITLNQISNGKVAGFKVIRKKDTFQSALPTYTRSFSMPGGFPKFAVFNEKSKRFCGRRTVLRERLRCGARRRCKRSRSSINYSTAMFAAQDFRECESPSPAASVCENEKAKEEMVIFHNA